MQTITSPPRRLPVGIAGLVARCGANLVSCLAAGLTIGWMVLLGLGSCAFTARGDVPEVWRTSIKLDGVSYRAGQLCWKRDVSSLDFSRIQRSPSTGGTVRAPYYNASAATRVWSRTAELDDSLNVYWASGGGKILSLGADATFTSALPTVLCAMETAGVLPPLVSVALNRVFWAERFGTFGNDAKIFFVQTAGGERTLVRDLAAVEGGVRQIAALTDTRLVYLNGYHQLYVVEWAGGPWVTVPVAENVTGFTLGNSCLYFAQRIPATGKFELRGVPTADLAGETTLHATIDGSAGLDVSELAVDSHALYRHEVRNVAGVLTGPICRRSFPRGLAQTLTSNLPGPLFLASDDRRIFWKDETNTKIMCLRVNAAARLLDLAVTGIDVFQILENPSNTVRRVAGKPTFARVFSQIVAADPATAEIAQAPLIQLRAFHAGTTTELAGSPLYPTRETELRGIYDRAQNPLAVDAAGRPAEGYFFRLPRGWTESGTIDVRAELNPAHCIRESNYANNKNTLTCAFERKAPIGMMVVPLRTHEGVIRHYDRSYQTVLDRTLALLPTSRLDVRWCGGAPMEEIEFLGWGPYEISLRDDDTSWVLAKLWARDYYSDDPDDIEALNGEVLWGSFFSPFSNQALNGVAQGYQLICEMEPRGSGVNTAFGGVVTAHEIGHNFDRAHVNFPAGDPDRPDLSYPYATNTFGPSSMIGYDPISQQLLANTAAGDLMSYAHRASPPMPMWPSDYTWHGIMDNIGNLPGSSPVPAPNPAPRDAPDAPTQLVLGMIHAGSATVNPVLLVPDSATSTRLANGFKTAADSTSYQWRMVAADGSATLYSTYAFFEDDGSDALLAGQLPVDETTVRVELVKAKNPATPLGMVEGGGAPPLVNWLVPGVNGSYAADGSIDAKWSASDPEGRDLSYSLRYTHDAGAHWRMILSQSPEPFTTIPLADLPGGPAGACKLQLIASDGIRSTIANSPAFAVATKAPEARILIEAETGRRPGLPALYVSVGQTVTLQGQGSDPEDGNIAADHLYWTIQGMQGGATGTDFRLESYPPGSYTVTLKAVDSESRAGTDSVLIVVEPKYVAASTGAPVLDGFTEDDDYAYDRQPQSILNRDGVRSPVRIVRHGGKLYLAVAGLPIGKDDNEYVAVTLDPQHSGGSVPGVGVRRFIIHADGRIVQEQGDGKGFVSLPGDRIFDARVGFNDTESWNAEFAIDLTSLGGDAGQNIGLDVGFYQRDTPGDDAHWLGGTQWNPSASRASVVMGVNPEDPRDDDADGMSDEWERRHFGDTSHRANEDPDGDGLDNAGEFLAGTDPSSGNSRFSAIIDGKQGNVGEFAMVWDSVDGRCYDVETSTDLVTFVPFRSGIIGTGGKLTVMVPKTSGQIFCRVHASLSR